MMVYGGQDELMSPKLSTILFERQSIGFGKANISLNIVDYANHQAAFFSMVDDSLDWFNSKLLPSVQPISISSWDQWFLSFVLLGVARGWDSGFLKVLQFMLILKGSMTV